jgi:hypothetical protein
MAECFLNARFLMKSEENILWRKNDHFIFDLSDFIAKRSKRSLWNTGSSLKYILYVITLLSPTQMCNGKEKWIEICVSPMASWQIFFPQICTGQDYAQFIHRYFVWRVL